MIKIFNEDEKVFKTAGNIIISPIKCLETKKKSLNGWYIDVEVPIEFDSYIAQDKLCVCKTKSKLNPQAFRIKNIQKTTRKIIFQAQHVIFDSEDYFLLDSRPTDKTAQNALSDINASTDKESPFTFYSDVEKISTAYFIRKSLLEAMQTIEERWGGSFDADNWTISLLQNAGNDNGETLNCGSDIQNVEVYEDWSEVCTKIYPVGYDGLLLPERFIESDIQYLEPYTRTISFSTEYGTEQQTEENLIEELRTNANDYLQTNKYPKVSYVVSANINEKLEIGDTVHVKHPLCTILTEVLEYEYNIISGKLKTITFGNYTRDVKRKFNAIKDTINKVQEELNKQEVITQKQTDLINSLNKNGYVYIDDNEILLLDAIPKSEAKNIWRIGLAGFGFSSNGYEGPFDIAITMDGSINANFITTGVMSVDRIEGLSESLELLVSNNNSLNEKYDELSITLNGLKNTLKQSGGNNIFYYAEEFWTDDTETENSAKLEEYTDTEIQQKSVSGRGYKIKNGTSKQKVSVKNDNYVISFKYKKLVNLATGYVLVNGKQYDLTENDWNEIVISVNIDTTTIEFEIISDTDNAFEIFDLMGSIGTEKQIWTQHPNETRTDTVAIGKGIQVNSNTMNTYTRIDADGNRTFNKTTGEVVQENTDKGSKAKNLEVEETAQIAGILEQKQGNQTWISSLL